jgi:UDP-2,3-diacylglucosamine pyrophosphatase LpxH
MRHTVVISDVHLCEAVPGSDPWMRWRQRPYLPDEEFSELIDALLAEARAPGDAIELVFNGDLFDFDAGRVIDGAATFEDLPRTETVANELIQRILDDHAGYVNALARLLRAGPHRVVFVSGNHDPQLAFDGVRARIRATVAKAGGDPSFAERVLFRAWFHHAPDGVHIEHGNQYDPYCSFRYPMMPHGPMPGTAEPEIMPTVGSIAFRYMASRMGYFNPHVDSSFMLSLPGYIAHWFKHYVNTPRDLAAPFVQGLFRMFAQLNARKDAPSADRAALNVQRAADETGADPVAVARHAALFSRPAQDAMHKVVREFWVDRALLGALCAAAVTVPLFARNRVAVGAAIGLPMVFAAYEYAVPKPSLDDNWNTVKAMSPRIAEIYKLRAVVFGHTHIPYGHWEGDVFHGNSGTWSAPYQSIDATEAVAAPAKPVIWLRSDAQRMEGGLYKWTAGHLIPDFSADDDARVEEVPMVIGGRSIPSPA